MAFSRRSHSRSVPRHPSASSAVHLLAPAGGFVACHRHIGNHRQIEIGHAAGQIRVDRDEVPHQRRLEVRPEVAAVRIRHHPVEQPRPPEMDQREERPGNERKRGDRLGAARNRPAPFGLHDAEDRRNERPRVADADPEHERRDVESPERRPVLARHADAVDELDTPRDEHHAGDRQQDGEHHVVDGPRLEERTEQVAIDLRFGRMSRGCLCASRYASASFRYTTRGRVPSSSSKRYPRRECASCETWLFGSLRSPKTSTFAGHACAHAG